MSEIKQHGFAELALMAQALSAPKRLELLDCLIQKPRPVDRLAQLTGMSVANTSRHLQVLRQVALVRVQQDGNRRIYELTGPEVVQLMMQLYRVARSHSSNLHRVLAETEPAVELEPVAAEELRLKLEQGEVVLLDVRPEEEYHHGHIPGAINIPLAHLQQRLQALSRDREVVAYCRGPFCLYAHEAVERLQQAGFQARRLEAGLPEWLDRGFALERTES